MLRTERYGSHLAFPPDTTTAIFKVSYAGLLIDNLAGIPFLATSTCTPGERSRYK